MMRLCAGACPAEGWSETELAEEKHAFGRCCLWATDRLATEEAERATSEGTNEERRRAPGPQMAVLAERGVAAGEGLVGDVAAALRECADWHGTPEVFVWRSEPKGVAARIATAVNGA